MKYEYHRYKSNPKKYSRASGLSCPWIYAGANIVCNNNEMQSHVKRNSTEELNNEGLNNRKEQFMNKELYALIRNKFF